MTKRGTLIRGTACIGFILLISSTALAEGVGLELSFYTVDLSATLAKVPAVVADSLDALGMPTADADDVIAELNASLAEIETVLPVNSLPVPLLGGSIEFPLQFVAIDGVRLSGGMLNDTILRGMADLFAIDMPQPLVDVEIEEDVFVARCTADLPFSTFMLSTELFKRLDLVIMGIEIGLGADLIQGRISPQVNIDAPGFQTEVDAALDALHLNDLRWSTFAVHATLGLEVGPPFLRLFARGKILLSISQSTGWWPISVASFAGKIGLVIRF